MSTSDDTPIISGNRIRGLPNKPMPPLPPLPPGARPDASAADGRNENLREGFRSNVGPGHADHTIADQARSVILTRSKLIEDLSAQGPGMGPDKRDETLGRMLNLHLDLKKAMGTQARFPKLWPTWAALNKELTSMLANVNPEKMIYTFDPGSWAKVSKVAKPFRVKAHKELG